MAGWQAIEGVSRTLQATIQRRVDAVSPGVDVQIVTPASFEQLGSTSSATVSVFLYRILENTETRNQLLGRGASSHSRPPLTLELGYLVTAWAARGSDTTTVSDETAAREEHRLLGLVLQTLAEHAEISGTELVEADPANPVFGPHDALQVVLESLPVEDHYRIWDSAELSYRLSLTYRVRVIGIDALEHDALPRVRHSTTRMGEGVA